MVLPTIEYFLIIISCVAFPLTMGQFEDSRCRCDCPSPKKMFTDLAEKNMTLSDRKLYIKNSAADDCLTDCNTMVASDVPINKIREYCLQCQCVYQYRNTTTIKVTVLLTLATVASLIVYLIWLKVLKYCFARGRPNTVSYDRHRDEIIDDVVVILVICVIGLLVVYLLFLLCLDPMLKQPRKDHSYERQENDEDNIFAGGEARSASLNSASGTSEARPRRTSEVLNKVEQQQNRWFAKVHEQRRKIFTDHTMLN